MAEQFQNFFVTKLREACDATATTIYVDTVPAITEGTLVLEYANSTKHEIIHFTGVSGYGLTGCTRGLEGTTAQSHSAGTDVRQNLTAGMIDKIINGVITTENIANSAVTTAKINNGAVTADKIDFTTIDDFQSWNSPNAGRADMSTATTLQSFTINKTGTYIAVGSIHYESYDHPLELNVVLSHNGVSTNVGRNYRNPSGKVDIYLTLDLTGIFQATEGDTISLIANPTNGAIGYYRKPETLFFKIARVC